MPQPFDACLVIAFGGPAGPADVRPFLANVLRGRRVTPERVEEVAHHYELFGGISPITELTSRQADGLRARLRERGVALSVHVGMRNWHPYLVDTLAQMSRDGIRRAIGFIAAAHRSYSSCTQYRENVRDARAELRRRGLADVDVTYVADWHTHDGFVEANAQRVAAACDMLPAGVRDEARLIFTAHSIPASMAAQYPYERQVAESADAVAARLRSPGESSSTRRIASGRNHAICYQSRSGRPEDPWLGPDINAFLRLEAQNGSRAAVLCPIGFICDHIEVLYDLDVEAAAVAREAGITMVRAAAVNDHPRFIDTMADAVTATIERYASGHPLQLVQGAEGG